MATASGVALPEKGFVKWARISQVVSATQFRCDSLIGFGDSYFNGFAVFVARKATGTGAAPQGESQIATAFVSSTGLVTCPAFTASLAIGDEILMILLGVAIDQISKLQGETPVAGSTTANWQAAEQTITTIGAVGVRYKVHSAMVSIQNLIGNVSLRMYISVNGVQRMIYPPKPNTYNVPGGDSPAHAIINGTFEIANVLTITALSDNAADNGQAITFEYALEAM
jgi:hypothetical protein